MLCYIASNDYSLKDFCVLCGRAPAIHLHSICTSCGVALGVYTEWSRSTSSSSPVLTGQPKEAFRFNRSRKKQLQCLFMNK